MNDLLSLKVTKIWDCFRKEHFSFWMVCGYLLVEYMRPQKIFPFLDVLPWGKIFILLSIVGLFADPKKNMSKDSTFFWMMLFLVVIIISSVTSYYPDWSYLHLEFYYMWVIVYFLVANIANTEKRIFLFILLFFLVSFKLSAFGAKTWAMRGFAFTEWGLVGPEGFFQNSGEYAIQMAVLFGMSYPFYNHVKDRLPPYKRWLLMLFPLTAAMSVLGASSRGAQLALVVQCYFLFLHGKLSIRTMVLAALVFVAIYYAIPEEQMARFKEAGDDKTSQQRLLYWKHGLDMLLDHPVLGVGYWNFPPYYEAHYYRDMLYDRAQLPHNIFVQVGADLGFVGLFIYCVLIYKAFQLTRVVRASESTRLDGNLSESWMYPISKGLDIAFIGFLVAGQFVSVAFYPFMWVQLALCVALKEAAIKLANEGKADARKARVRKYGK